jgi:hypothetical protein
MFVDQNEKRDLISKTFRVQIPNPGSVSPRAKREIVEFLPPPPCRVTIGSLYSPIDGVVSSLLSSRFLTRFGVCSASYSSTSCLAPRGIGADGPDPGRHDTPQKQAAQTTTRAQHNLTNTTSHCISSGVKPESNDGDMSS